jgi:HK97 family phage prohead protease
MSKTATRKSWLATVSAVAGSADEPELMVTTSAPDREGDVVVPEGIELTNYRKNPVVLWAHDYQSLPVATCTAINVVPGRGLRARFRWLDGDPFADRVRRAWDAGVVRAASIGFAPLRVEPNDAGYTYTRSELLEWSLVPVPANPEAVRVMRSLGLSATAKDPHSCPGPDGEDKCRVGINEPVEGCSARGAGCPMWGGVRPRSGGADQVFLVDEGMLQRVLERCISTQLPAQVRAAVEAATAALGLSRPAPVAPTTGKVVVNGLEVDLDHLRKRIDTTISKAVGEMVTQLTGRVS